MMNPSDNSSPLPTAPASPQKPASSKKKKSWIIIVVVVLVVAVGAYALTKHKKSPTTSTNHAITETPEGGKQTESELADYKQEVTVSIDANGPSPQTLNVPNDSRINWMNKDSVAHKIAITPGATVPPKFDDNHQIAPAGGYPFVIHQTGTYHYYIVENPTQTGTFIVK